LKLKEKKSIQEWQIVGKKETRNIICQVIKTSLLNEPKWQACLMKENENNIATNVWVHRVLTKTNVWVLEC
jgi:hypothetical protein